MEKFTILVVAAHPDIRATILRLINAEPEWSGTGCPAAEEAKEIFRQQSFDMALIGAGLEEEAEAERCRTISSLHPGVKIVKHYGGGSGLLRAEIQGVVDATKEN